GERGTKGKKAEKPKRGKIGIQLLVEQPVEQTSSLGKIPAGHPAATRCTRALQTSSARSSLTPRDAFSSTASPSRTSRVSHSPAASGASKKCASTRASAAALTISRANPRTPTTT